MIQHDKCAIVYGLMGLLQDNAGFVKRINGKWIFYADAFRAHIRKIKEAGADAVRFLAYGVWGSHPGQSKEYQFSPYLLNAKKTLWDLSKFNPDYFSIVEQVMTIINAENLSIIFALFDNCQFHKKSKNADIHTDAYTKWSPWVNNVQGLLNFYGKDADKYSKAWISTWIVRAKRNGYDIIFGSNETENAGYPDCFKRVIIPYMKRGLLKPERMTYGATTKIGPTDSIQDQVRNMVEATFGKAAERAIIMEDHGYPFTASLPAWGRKPWRKLYSDDGLHPRPTPTQWGARAKYILNYAGADRARFVNFEHLPEAYPIDLALDAKTIKAISAACKV